VKVIQNVKKHTKIKDNFKMKLVLLYFYLNILSFFFEAQAKLISSKKIEDDILDILESSFFRVFAQCFHLFS